MNKKIAIAANTSWNIYNFRLGLIRALQKEGYQIIAVTPSDNYTYKLRDCGIRHVPIHLNNKGTNPFEDTKLLFEYYRNFRHIRPDVVLNYTIKPNIYGTLAAGMLKIPVVSNISGLGTVFLNDRLSSMIARKLYRLALKVPKVVFFQNQADRELFIRTKLVNASKTDLLPGSGIDTEKFKPSPALADDRSSVRFLLIARLVRDKGVLEYIEAVRQILPKYPEAEFSVLGPYYPNNPTAITPSEMNRWEQEGLITYLGTSDDVKPAIDSHDCIVLPSYREGLSRVLLEAAALAKPIITTDVPGCREVVDEGVNGLLCQARDPNSLAECIRKILSLDATNRRKMGEAGREKVRREFDERLVIDQYKKAINKLIHRGL